jgi:hypothetical protein
LQETGAFRRAADGHAAPWQLLWGDQQLGQAAEHIRHVADDHVPVVLLSDLKMGMHPQLQVFMPSMLQTHSS